MAKSVVKSTTIYTLEREVKNSVLYKADGRDVVATNVYISKSVFGGSGAFPEKVKLTVEAAD
jgi:hypothetical protein